MRAVESLEIWSFCPKYLKIFLKRTGELCLMTPKSDAKFEDKLNLGSKNNTRNLVNFNAMSVKSENFHSDVLLLSIAYKISAKKYRRIISNDTEKLSKRWRKADYFVWKMKWRVWWTLKPAVESLKINTLMSFDNTFVKNDLSFQKWYKEFREFTHK